MTDNDPSTDSYLPETEYFTLVEALRMLTTIILFELQAKSEASPADQTRFLIIRNFLSRAQVTLDSIVRLYESRAFGDCWTLYRTIVDRLFYVHTLRTKNEFIAFEEWSFLRQYEINNNIFSDTMLLPRQKAGVPKPTEDQKSRYKELRARGVVWREPKPEDAAKSLELPFLYKFGYDFASRFLHPLASDGRVEFESLTELGEKGDRGDQRIVLHNSALSEVILLNESLLATELEWRKLVFAAIEEFRKALTGEGLGYREALARIAAAGPDLEWARTKPPAPN